MISYYFNRVKKVHLVNEDHKAVLVQMAETESEARKVNVDKQVPSVQKDIVEKLVCLDIKELILSVPKQMFDLRIRPC